MKIFYFITANLFILILIFTENSIADISLLNIQICSVDIAENNVTGAYRNGKEFILKKGEVTKICFDKFDVTADAGTIEIEVNLHNNSVKPAPRIRVNYSVSYTVARRVQHGGDAFEFLDREATAKTAKFFGVLSSDQKTIDLDGNATQKITFQLQLLDLMTRLNKRNLFVTELSFYVSAEPPEAEMSAETTLTNNVLEKKLVIPLPLD